MGWPWPLPEVSRGWRWEEEGIRYLQTGPVDEGKGKERSIPPPVSWDAESDGQERLSFNLCLFCARHWVFLSKPPYLVWFIKETKAQKG